MSTISQSYTKLQVTPWCVYALWIVIGIQMIGHKFCVVHYFHYQFISWSTLSFISSDLVKDDVNITFVYEQDNGTKSSNTEQIKLSVSQQTHHSNSSTTWQINAVGEDPGHVTLVLQNITDNSTHYELVWFLVVLTYLKRSQWLLYDKFLRLCGQTTPDSCGDNYNKFYLLLLFDRISITP